MLVVFPAPLGPMNPKTLPRDRETDVIVMRVWNQRIERRILRPIPCGGDHGSAPDHLTLS